MESVIARLADNFMHLIGDLLQANGLKCGFCQYFQDLATLCWPTVEFGPVSFTICSLFMLCLIYVISIQYQSNVMLQPIFTLGLLLVCIQPILCRIYIIYLCFVMYSIGLCYLCIRIVGHLYILINGQPIHPFLYYESKLYFVSLEFNK